MPAQDFPDWTDGVQLVSGTITALTDFPDWTKAQAIVGGGPFTPNAPQTITNLTWWHDASLITGIADGALLPKWPSLVNTPLYDLTQNNPFRPTLYTTTASKLINGRPAVWFGGSQALIVSPVPTALSQPVTIYMVAGLSAISGTQVLFDNDSGSAGVELQLSGGNWVASAGVTGTDGVATTGPHLFVVTANGTSSSLIVDGVTTSGNLGTNTFQPITVGCDRNSNNFMTGFVCETGGYTRVLNAAELATLHAYSQTKWGTP